VPRPSRITLIFALAFAAVIIGPPELGRGQFGPDPDMKWQDVLDLATPIVMLPAYWLLIRQPGWAPDLDRSELVLFLGLGAVWAEAQGMHLAANSIDNLVAGQTAAPAVPLIHMFDEIVSHYLWLLAIVGLAALAYVRERRHPLLVGPADPAGLVVEAIAGLIYGFTFFDISSSRVGRVPSAFRRPRRSRSFPCWCREGVSAGSRWVRSCLSATSARSCSSPPGGSTGAGQLPQFTEVGLF